jgi:hypothetical protein
MAEPKDQDRHPIRTAGQQVGAWVSFAVIVIGGAAGTGVALLTDDQADALTALANSLPALVGVVGVVLTAFGIRRKSEPLTTPLVDPRSAEGKSLYVVE